MPTTPPWTKPCCCSIPSQWGRWISALLGRPPRVRHGSGPWPIGGRNSGGCGWRNSGRQCGSWRDCIYVDVNVNYFTKIRRRPSEAFPGGPAQYGTGLRNCRFPSIASMSLALLFQGGTALVHDAQALDELRRFVLGTLVHADQVPISARESPAALAAQGHLSRARSRRVNTRLRPRAGATGAPGLPRSGWCGRDAEFPGEVGNGENRWRVWHGVGLR